jgi:PhoPQ-activated pathogenicity-related protein
MKLRNRRGTLLAVGLPLLLAVVSPGALLSADTDVADRPRAIPTPLNTDDLVLDQYIKKQDDAFSWKIVHERVEPQATTYVVHLVSQKWLRPDEVDRTLWEHSLVIVRPKTAQANTALLFIGGGSNERKSPTKANDRIMQVALATNTVVAELGMVPNQPLIFHNDGKPRFEDDLIAYTWDHFLETGDRRWLARLPMVKSAVRAMDAVQALLRQQRQGGLAIDKFVVAGGSKRGWTTWMTGAVDQRVTGIMPIVIDVLNLDISMRHHYAAYGFWAPAIGDYVNHQIMHRRNTPRYAELIKLVDPFAYRNRYTMPKCLINATGDQFFVPDSSQFYFSQLPGEKHLCYVPNADHSLDESNALDTLVAFYYALVNQVERPEFSWSFEDSQTVRVTCKKGRPKRALLWQAVNTESRDFRVDTIGRAYESHELTKVEDGQFVARAEVPKEGWRAFFVQLEFDIGAPRPLRLSTPVRVVPETLPFEDQEPPLLQSE